MFKKLRNNFLAVNCVTIAALIIACFGINYLMIYQGMRSSTERKLENEIKIAERRLGINAMPEAGVPPEADAPPEADVPPGADAPPEADVPPDGEMHPGNKEAHNAPYKHDEREDFGKNQSFSPTFSIITDTDGNVSEISMAFSMAEDFYNDRAAQIIRSGKSGGRIHETDDDGSVSNWRYLLKEFDGGYIIAFTEVSSGIYMLRMLALCLLLIALAAVIVTVFISIFFANRSIRPIEEAYNKQKQFVADASHELKTPLSAINTNIDVLLSLDDVSDEERKWMMYIKEEARRMSKLTTDLLYLARSDYDAGNKIFSSVSWTDILKNSLLVMEARVYEKDVVLSSDIAEGVNVAADAEKLKQLVIILLDNAVKYTDAGGKIDVRLQKKASEAYLTIRNTGAGISDEDLPHIFDRFYRSDKSRTYTETSGFGLGLAIAKAIAESFKGTIEAQSEPDKYTEFIVRLPSVR